MTRENVLTWAAALVIALGVRIALSPSKFVMKETPFLGAKLEFSNLPDGLMVVGAPTTVPFKATGTGQYLDQLDPASVTAVVDLSMARAGSRLFLVDVKAPARAHVTITLQNLKIRLNIQKLASIVETVVIEPSGQPPREFIVDRSSSLPEKVTIVGAESFLPRVKKARVSLDLDQVRPGATFMLPVEILDEENQVVPYVHAEPAEVLISPAVVAASTMKRLIVTPNWSGQPAFGYKVASYEVRPSQVEVRGESATISRLATIDTEPVSIAGLKADGTIRAKLKLPPGTKTTESSEVTVIVKVARRPGNEMSGP